MTSWVEVSIWISFTINFLKVRDKQVKTEIRQSGWASVGARSASSGCSGCGEGKGDALIWHNQEVFLQSFPKSAHLGGEGSASCGKGHQKGGFRGDRAVLGEEWSFFSDVWISVMILLRQTSLALSNTNTSWISVGSCFQAGQGQKVRCRHRAFRHSKLSRKTLFQDGYAQPDETRSDKP